MARSTRTMLWADGQVVLCCEYTRRVGKFGCLFDTQGCTNVAVAWMQRSDLEVHFLWQAKKMNLKLQRYLANKQNTHYLTCDLEVTGKKLAIFSDTSAQKENRYSQTHKLDH